MPNDTIHYVWAGDLNTAAKQACCELGPKSLAQTSPHSEIKIWVPEVLILQAQSLFSEQKNINVVSIERMLTNQYGKLIHISDKAKDVLQIYTALNSPRSYVTQKDLISFAVVAEYGGYFFDTTTRIINDPELKPIQEFKVALCSENRELPPEMEYPWQGADVWTFAAEAGHPLMLAMLDDCKSVFEVNKGKPGMRGAAFGTFDGPLTLLYGERPTTEVLKKFSWEKIKSDRIWFIPELHLEKYNMGTWRTQDFPSDEEIQRKLRDILSDPTAIRGPAPPVGLGPAPPVGLGPAPPVGLGPAPPVGLGPAPPVGLGPAPPVGPTPLPISESSQPAAMSISPKKVDVPFWVTTSPASEESKQAPLQKLRLLQGQMNKTGMEQMGRLIAAVIDIINQKYIGKDKTTKQIAKGEALALKILESIAGYKGSHINMYDQLSAEWMRINSKVYNALALPLSPYSVTRVPNYLTDIKILANQIANINSAPKKDRELVDIVPTPRKLGPHRP